MKYTITPANKAAVASRFRAFRKAHFGAFALLSLSTVRALETVETRNHNRITCETVTRTHTRADETPEEALIGPSQLDTGDQDVGESSTLNHAERIALHLARPQSRGVVFFAPATVAPDEALPVGFVPSPVADYVSEIVTLDASEEAAIRAEAEAEANAILAQIDGEVKAEIEADKEAARKAYAIKLAAQTKPAPVLAEIAPAMPLPISADEALRLAVLAS